MMKLTTGSYGGERDLEAIAEMLQECEKSDRLDEWVGLSDVRERFETPLSNGIRDARLWFDDNNQLQAVAQLSVPELGKAMDGALWFRSRPTARNQGIEGEIIEWGERRMKELGAAKNNSSLKLFSEARDRQTERKVLLESSGFTICRYFYRMERSLLEPFGEPQLPPEFKLRSALAPEFGGARSRQLTRAWVEMFNQTFIDHWNHHQLTVEELESELNNPNYRPDLDFIAVAADGTFAAFCYCFIHQENNHRTGCREGFIAALGTRRGFRRQGLGRAMLLVGMQHLKAAGMKKALLGVDAENPSGAMELYRSVGFRPVRTLIHYMKQL